MERFTKWLVKTQIKDWQQVNTQSVRTRYGVLGGWMSIWLNVLLSIVKALLGVFTGSISLIADAIHSLSDAGTSIVIVVSFKMAEKPPDDNHPFGHGRMEAVATLIISLILILVGFELGKNAFERILHPRHFEFSWLAVSIILVTIIMKEGLARLSRELAKMIDSSALEADFWHHRIDAISSALVIIAFIGQRHGLAWIDGLMGLVIAITIIYTGYKIARNGIDELLGKAPSENLIRDIKKVVSEIPEVLDVHDLIIHQYGTRSFMSMHISVSDKFSLKYCHDLSEIAVAKVNSKFNTYATVHLDPVSDAENFQPVH